MSVHTADVLWLRGGQDFLANRYSRRHTIRFDGGAEIAGSSSPSVVPLPLSDASAIDPEECFVASLSSCHMLWFLSIAAERGFCVERYVDSAAGHMGVDAAGRMAMIRVTLRPAVQFSGEKPPGREEIAAMHHLAHDRCFIANSVRTQVLCEPVFGDPTAQ